VFNKPHSIGYFARMVNSSKIYLSGFDMTVEKKNKVPAFNIWEGVYTSYEMAAEHAVNGGFSSRRYVDSARRAAKECLDAFLQKRRLPLFHKQRFTLLPSTVYFLFNQVKRKLRVIDFGGALGVGYLSCLEAVTEANTKLNYCVVELDEVCAEGAIFCEENNLPIEYSRSLVSDQYCDLLFCSSTLQYIRDYKALISSFARTDASIIMLSDVFCGDFESSFVTIQNYHDSKIPHWFFSTAEIVNEFQARGYELALRTDAQGNRAGACDYLPMSNFPEAFQLALTSHLIFQKNR
jgi:putative methyltransferase (TIGR04325 family)